MLKHKQTLDRQMSSDEEHHGDAAANVDGQAAPETALALRQTSVEEAKAHVAFALHLVSSALHGGEGPILAPVLIRFLPFLIRVQVVVHSGRLMFQNCICFAGAKPLQTQKRQDLPQRW